MSHPNAAIEIVEKLVKQEFDSTVNAHGDHQCESPLVRMVNTNRRQRAARALVKAAEKEAKAATPGSRRGARAVVRMRKLFRRKAKPS